MSPEMIIQVLLGVLGFFGVMTLNDLKNTVKEATRSVEELNIKVAVIIARTEIHGEEIEKLKEDMRKFTKE
jgi:uncharacterized protein YoxC